MTDITPICEKKYVVAPEFLEHYQQFDEPPVRVDPTDLHLWRRWMQETVGEVRLAQINSQLRLRKIKEAYAAQLNPVPRWVREESETLDEEGLHTSCRFHLLSSDHAQLLFAQETRGDPWKRCLDYILGVEAARGRP